jgi:hypothetical protein
MLAITKSKKLGKGSFKEKAKWSRKTTAWKIKTGMCNHGRLPLFYPFINTSLTKEGKM